ncbi:hypothetical protein WBG78_22405 [Chryseolinea sp. T2]|uniref:hypothetical protein n=1 Tax=Chryseolinea sp. T2 TaxID=3129255 RepID=UPI0030773433
MIIKVEILHLIHDGKVTLQFRKWTKPSVKKGTLLKTAIGQVEITSIDVVKERDISEVNAKSAGYESRESLVNSLQKVETGEIYKVAVRYHSEDPRIKLRSTTDIGDEKYQQLIKKLQRFDAVSKEGPWTKETLDIISKHPHVVSTELASKLGRERMWLKLNIRKLKNLGLTISHEIGYEISPLGKVVLGQL